MNIPEKVLSQQVLAKIAAQESIEKVADVLTKIESRDYYSILMRAALLVQALKDKEQLVSEMFELRNILRECSSLASDEYITTRTNLEDKKVTRKLLQESIKLHTAQLEKLLEKVLEPHKSQK